MFPRKAVTPASFTSDLNFEACDNGIDARITTTGGANRTRVNGSGVVEAAAGARVDHKRIGRTNTLKSSVDMSDAAYWLQNVGGWWTSAPSFDKPPPERGARVTKYVRTAAAAGDAVFTRCNSLSIPAGARSGSVYIWVPSGQGVTSFRVHADWQDVEQGTQVTSALFDQWVRINSTATVAATRTFLDFNIAVNGGSLPSTGFTWYCAAPQESDALTAWIPTGAASVTVFDSLGLLQEPGRVQALTAPNDVTNAAWSKSFVTAPNADTLRETTDNNYHLLSQFPATTAGEVVCFSLEAKADGRNICIVQISDGGSNALQAGFDLNNLVTGGYAVTFGAASSIQRQSVALEDGWVALQVSGIYSPTATLAAAQFYLLDSTGAAIYAGDITKGMKVRNLNFTHGRFATSPILSATTTTPADHVLSGSNFSSYFTPQGTYLIEFTPYALTNLDVYWGIGQAGVFNNSMYLANVANSLGLYVVSAGVNTAMLDLGPLVAGARYKVGISYQAGEIAARVNGGTERVSSGAMPAVIDTEGLLKTTWAAGVSYPAAHMHRRRHSPVPRRNELYALTV